MGKVLTTSAVCERTGLSRTTIWRLERDGKFPKRKTLANIRGAKWYESEVDAWVKDNLRDGTDPQPVNLRKTA